MRPDTREQAEGEAGVSDGIMEVRERERARARARERERQRKRERERERGRETSLRPISAATCGEDHPWLFLASGWGGGWGGFRVGEERRGPSQTLNPDVPDQTTTLQP